MTDESKKVATMYIIVRGATDEDLIRAVTFYLERGYRPAGGLAIQVQVGVAKPLAQAMYLPIAE